MSSSSSSSDQKQQQKKKGTKQTSFLTLENDVKDLPVKHERRSCTDVCCIAIGFAFTVILIIVSLLVYNADTFNKTSFPTDTDGNICGQDLPQYPYLYLSQYNKINPRFCVQSCPGQFDTELTCYPNKATNCLIGSDATYYDNEVLVNSNGNFCAPKDQAQRKEWDEVTKLDQRDVTKNSIAAIMNTLWIIIVASLVYFILVQCLPTIMNIATVIGGCVIILALCVCFFLYPSTLGDAKVPVTIVLVILFIIILINSVRNINSLKMHAIFLKHATKFIKDQPITLLYIPLFLLFMAGFLALWIWQFRCMSASGGVTFNPDESLYYEHDSPVGLGYIPLTIQAIWGFMFLKQAFNFCVSGNAAFWYYKDQKSISCCNLTPAKWLVCKNLGSVIAGAFMVGFFSIFDFIFDLFKPSNRDSAYGNCYQKICCCADFFDLVRSDAMAYVALTSNPYCNSSRYCQYLCGNTMIMDNSQSSSRTYRLCAHLLLAGIVGICALYFYGEISPYALGLVIIICIFICTLFISIHADAAEALQILYLTDEEFNKRRDGNNHVRGAANFFAFDQSTDTKAAEELHKDVQQERSKQFDKIRDKAEKKREKEQQKQQKQQQKQMSEKRSEAESKRSSKKSDVNPYQ